MEQKIVNYASGITRSPSDILAQDGHLAECINLETRNGELYPMEMPTDMGINLGDDKLLYIHSTINGVHNYIVHGRYQADDAIESLMWFKDGERVVIDSNVGEIKSISSFGKTLRAVYY